MSDVKESAETIAVTFPPRSGRPLLDHALWYAQERRWEVLPGTWLEIREGTPHCSCGVPACTAPGAHPAWHGWAARATSSVSAVRRLWTAEPRAAVLLPTGRAFDVIEVPEGAGCLALARMMRTGLAPGPVSATPYGRMMFFVMPGGAARVAGWTPGADILARGQGDVVPAPPTRMGTRGGVQWVREPTTASRWLPDAGELLPVLAYACAQGRR